MTYAILFSDAAERQLGRVPRPYRNRILARIEGLAEDPFPHPPNPRKLVGHDLYRLRVGEYRVIYAIDRGKLRVLIVEPGTRGGIYRDY